MGEIKPTGTCPDCGADVVFFRLENGRCSPPMRPERTREGYWQVHECSFAERHVGKIGRTRMHRHLDGCSEHQVVRKEDSWQFIAIDRETRRVVSASALDHVCRRKLQVLRDELQGLAQQGLPVTPQPSEPEALLEGPEE